MSLVFGLDLGTTSLSAVAVRVRDGVVVARLSRPNAAHRSGLPAGHAEQDPNELKRGALAILRDLTLMAPGNPACLGLTGQMHGGLLVDARRQPLTSLISWQDRRALEMENAGTSNWLERFRRLAPADAMERAGCVPSAGYLGVTLFTLQCQSGIPSGSERAVMPADWIAAELCDTDAVIDRTNAASTGLYDLQHERWSDEILSATKIPPRWLPELRPSGAVMGVISPEIAAETGLPAGLPVGNAIGDNQAAVLGSVPTGDPAIQINVGTGGQINWPVPAFVRVAGMETRPLPIDRYMVVGAGLAGGDAYAWVIRTVQNWLRTFQAPHDEAAVYEAVTRLASEASDDCGGLTCEPLFRGTRRQPNARGSFQGITPENFTPGNVGRAVIQGIANGMRWFFDQAGPAKPDHLPRIVGSGNGLRKNPLLTRVLARTFDRPVWMTDFEEEAAVGAALIAGTRIGLWSSLEEAGRCLSLKCVASPNE